MAIKIIFSFIAAFLLFSCTYDTLEPSLDCTDRITLEVVRVKNSSCGLDQGEIEISVVDPDLAVGSIQFSIDGGTSFQNNGIFSNLSAGDYTVLVRDDECSEMINATIVNQDGLNATISGTSSQCGQSTAVVTVEVNDAIGIVQYAIDGGANQEEPVFNGISTGGHTVVVSDASGCSIELSINIMSDVAYENVESIIRTNCAISGCHAGNVSPDLRVKSNIINSANSINNRVSRRSMPPRSSGIQLSTEEIEAISCWVTDGAQG